MTDLGEFVSASVLDAEDAYEILVGMGSYVRATNSSGLTPKHVSFAMRRLESSAGPQ